ncbi:SAV_915 family protein [Streptomyces sp. NPDC001927]
MSEVEHSEDPEPSERIPAGPLLVPVRSGPAGYSARLFRTPLGDRTAVGFTSEAGLAATLGPDHACIRLSEPALRSLVAPLGVTALTVDPQLCAPAVSKTHDVSKPHDVSKTHDGSKTHNVSKTHEVSNTHEVSKARDDESSWRNWDPQHVGVLRVTGAAALVSCVHLLIG